jgi:hypothetical protein
VQTVWLKRLIWIYFFLLLFEGALRRWIFPQLAGPLLLIREPVAIGIIFLAFRQGVLQRTPLLWAGMATGILSFLLTMIAGHGNLFVGLYGLRIFLLHLPIIFIIGRVFNLLDVWKLGRILCIISIPMTGLIAAQFFLPQSHLVNIGIGGEGTAGFSGAEGRFRPPGTFSFILGLTQFYALAAVFLAAGTLHGKLRPWWFAAMICLILAVPFSISRTLLFHVLGTLAVLFVIGVTSPRLSSRLIGATLVIGILALFVVATPAFKQAMPAFSSRFEAASKSEGGLEGTLIDRFLGGMWGALTGANEVPLLGYGIGLGTNAGAALATGKRAFLITEGEWGRVIGEMGPFLGLAFIGVRVLISVAMIKTAIWSWRKGNVIPMLIASVAVLWVAQGNFAQPTSLGFSVLAGGLALAAARLPDAHKELSKGKKESPDAKVSSHSPG